MARLYLNELAPWQEKSQHYNIIQLGNDIQVQNGLIRQQTREVIKGRIGNASEIVVSSERITEMVTAGLNEISSGLDELLVGISDVAEGIYGLRSAFELGISEVVWQIEQNREVLKSINEGIWNPFSAQARNKKKLAEEAYTNDWIEEAEKYFLESKDIIEIDFSVHMSLGMIYLLKKIDKRKALEYFQNAAKYAKPKSSYYRSFALIHIASIKRDMGLLEEAVRYAEEAVITSPEMIEAQYQLALYNALLDKKDEAIENLEACIENDINYCLKIENEKDFDGIREKINWLFKNKRESLRNETKALISVFFQEVISKDVISRANARLNYHYHQGFQDIYEIQDKVDPETFDEVLRRDSIIDYYLLINNLKVIIAEIKEAKKKYLDLIDSEEKFIKGKIDMSRKSIQHIEHKIKDELPGNVFDMFMFSAILTVFSSLGIGLVSLFMSDFNPRFVNLLLLCGLVSLVLCYFIVFSSGERKRIILMEEEKSDLLKEYEEFSFLREFFK